MFSVKKQFIIPIIIAIVLIAYIDKKGYAQRYKEGSVGIQASYCICYGLKNKYINNGFKALNLGVLKYNSNYVRSMAELFYSEKTVLTGLYKSDIKDYISSYGYGFNVLDIFQQFFTVFTDFGALLGYEHVNNYDKAHSSINAPFRSGLLFGLYSQLNAELSVFNWLAVYARIQISYNGPIVYEQWPFYQGIGARIIFN